MNHPFTLLPQSKGENCQGDPDWRRAGPSPAPPPSRGVYLEGGRNSQGSRPLTIDMVGSRLFLLLSLPCLAAALSSDLERWSDAAYRWILKDCHGCTLHKSQARLYFAKPHHKGRLRVVSADGGTRHAGLHDSVLVIDPHPERRPGHPLHMFFVDLNVSRQHCETRAGVLLEGGDCLLEYRRPRCIHRLRRQGCALFQPPEVRAAGSRSGPDLLVCSGLWGPCPRPRAGPAGGPCDPLATNGKGCPAALAPPCFFMRTCHHALIISGGWNKQLTDENSFKNVHKINNVLRRNGFAESNIQIFFANGMSQSEEEIHSSELGNIYPSNLKFAFRYHLKSICETKHCSKTLFVYLNNPTFPDGTSLLWDSNGNGEFDDSEVYTVRELLSDLGNCKVKRLILIVDQAFSGELIKGMKKHTAAFRNVLVLAADEESGRQSLVDKLSRLEPWQCFPHGDLEKSWVGEDVARNVTLVGTPCNRGQSEGIPPSCQNLSTFEILEPEQTIDLT